MQVQNKHPLIVPEYSNDGLEEPRKSPYSPVPALYTNASVWYTYFAACCTVATAKDISKSASSPISFVFVFYNRISTLFMKVSLLRVGVTMGICRSLQGGLYTDFSFLPVPGTSGENSTLISASLCVGRGKSDRDRSVIDNVMLLQVLPPTALLGKWTPALATHMYFKYPYHPSNC